MSAKDCVKRVVRVVQDTNNTENYQDYTTHAGNHQAAEDYERKQEEQK